MAEWRGICPIGCDTATHLGEERKQYQVISQYGKTIFVCIYSCSLPKSTKYRTSSTFWYLMFYDVILELCPRLFSSPWRLLHSANEEELSQSFKALRKLTLVTISQYYNIMISQNHKIKKSQNHNIT